MTGMDPRDTPLPNPETTGAQDSDHPDLSTKQDTFLSRLTVSDVCVLILTVLAVLCTLYFTSAIVLPLVFAIVLNLLMLAPMRFLQNRLRLPRHFAALLLIIVMFGVVAAIATTLSVPAAAWLSRASQTLPALHSKFAMLHAPIDAMQSSYLRLSSLFSGHRVRAVNGPIGGETTLSRLGSSVLAGTRQIVSGFLTMLLMLFFLMTDGDALLRRLVEITPNFADKRRIVDISQQIEENISLYLVTITVMNLLVGLANTIQCWATGMPNPLLWGVLAFLLNYIPIIGPLTGVAVYFIVGIFTFPSLLYALVPPSIYLLIHLLEGETVTPMLLARRFTLNPVFVIGSLLFWDWMWGIAGAFLSVPMLACFKIVCDHIETLAPVGHLLGGPPRRRALTSIAAQFQPDS